MAHTTSNSAVVFDSIINQMKIENVASLCVYAASNTNIYLEVWDTGQNTLAFRPNAGGTKLGAIMLVVTTVASSIAYLAQQAYEGSGLSVIDTLPKITGLPDGAVGGFLLVDSAGSHVYYNVAGTADGSVGDGFGIASGRAGPNAFSPRILPPGGTLKIGGFIE